MRARLRLPALLVVAAGLLAGPGATSRGFAQEAPGSSGGKKKPAPAAPPSGKGGDKSGDKDAAAAAAPPPIEPAILEATATYARNFSVELRTSVRGRIVVRGDHPQEELDRIADASDAAFRHFLAVVGSDADDLLRRPTPGTTSDTLARIELFSFRREKEYLALLDKVVARIRDDTVDDRRLALMRRQLGFFLLSPKALLGQYQGPGEMDRVLAQSVHKTSHVALLLWKQRGGWQPWWLLEGFAAWQEMAVRGESRVYCLDVPDPAGYATPGTPEADEAAKARMEDAWRKKVRELVRSGKAVDLPVLARRALNELSFDDVVQAWSVVRWVNGRGRLREFLVAMKEQKDLDAACTKALGKNLAGTEQDWRAWALSDER